MRETVTLMGMPETSKTHKGLLRIRDRSAGTLLGLFGADCPEGPLGPLVNFMGGKTGRAGKGGGACQLERASVLVGGRQEDFWPDRIFFF